MVSGKWDTIAPPPKTFYDNLGNFNGPIDDGGDAEPVPDANFDRTAMDGPGNLHLRYPKAGCPDSILSLRDGSSPDFSCLPPIPAHRCRWDTTSSPGRVEIYEKLRADGTPYLEPAADELAGGGTPSAGGGYTYVVISRY